MMTLAALILVTGPLSPAAPVPKDRPATPQLVGSWKLVKSSNGSEQLSQLVVEFQTGGKMIIRQSGQGIPETMYEGTYQILDGKKIPYVMKIGDFEKKETLTIKKLTAETLSLVDPDGIQEDFQRLKPATKAPRK